VVDFVDLFLLNRPDIICINYVWKTRYKSEIKQYKFSTIELAITHHIFQTR